ncbi:MAG: hypothetical protein IT370_37525 [Deltaproteobacteria bacterium]|nr:hypothetical protein [Deltaproteobacteria bacterium]
MADVHSLIGDRAGEHLQMRRGRYRAWIHVIIGFFWAALLLALTSGLAVSALTAWVAMDVCGLPGDDLDLVMIPSMAVTALIIGLLAYADRWRCNEAFSSRFSSGLLNLSLTYVPLVSAWYGLARGLAKLTRERKRRTAK